MIERQAKQESSKIPHKSQESSKSHKYKYALIAGNAPSLKEIDYARLPLCRGFSSDFADSADSMNFADSKYLINSKNSTNSKNSKNSIESLDSAESINFINSIDSKKYLDSISTLKSIDSKNAIDSMNDSLNLNCPPIYQHSQARDMFSDFAIFRCNQFYFEEKYYLGKRVDYAFLSNSFILENTFTYNALKQQQEYAINHIVNANIGFKYLDNFSNVKHIFPYILSGIESIKTLKSFFAFMQFNELYYYKRPTSGIYMCAYAVSLGYKDIYLAGIDFYEGQNYAFNSAMPNIMLKVPNFGPVGIMHDKEFDIKALEFLAKHYGVNFYSICPNSPLSCYIPLAKTHQNNHFAIQNKPKDCTKDIIIPNNVAYQHLNQEAEAKNKIFKISSPYHTSNDVAKLKSGFKQNIIFKIFKDIFSLPRDLFRYLQGKKLQRKLKIIEKTGGGGE